MVDEPAHALGSPGLRRLVLLVREHLLRQIGRAHWQAWAEDLDSAAMEVLATRGRHLKLAHHQVRCAKSAMIDELRRLNRHGPLLLSHDGKPRDTACPRPRPDDWAHAAGVLAELERIAPGWPAALLTSGTLSAAGRAMGTSESAASLRCGALTKLALQLADKPVAPPTAVPKPTPPRKPQRISAQALHDAEMLLSMPGLSASVMRKLRALRDHRCIKRAAHALGVSDGAIRIALFRARGLMAGGRGAAQQLDGHD